MKLDFNIGISQRQGLTLTLQVQQAIKLLQMTNLEVNEYIEENFAINPFIELKDQISREQQSNKSDAKSEKPSTAQALEETPFGTEKNKTKTEIENQFETGESFKTKSTVSKEQSDFDPVQMIKSHEKSLYVHCGDYIANVNFSVQERLVAYKFLEELEATGWICVSVQDIAKETSTNVEIVQTVLESLQQIEPAGLFARTLSECLTLQAAELGLLDGTLKSILENLLN